MSDDDRVGQVIDGRYRVERALAEGGMGAVYVAEHVSLHRPVAIKFLRREIADVPGAAARFEREARATSQLDHPHIVHVSDFGRTADGAPYLVMELLVGRSLGALLAEHGRLSVERALAIADQMLAGLQAAHMQGVVHRDLKPDNIFLRDDASDADDVKVLDFGIASMRGEHKDTRLTQTGAVMGTPAYMAPEQAMGQRESDARADLHAVGVMLYQMLAGRAPYAGDNYQQILHAIIVGAPAPLEGLRTGLPRALYAAVTRAMATEPSARFQDSAAFRAALRLGESPAASATPAGPAFAMPAALVVTDLREAPQQESSADVWGLSSRERAAASAPATPSGLLPSNAPALAIDRVAVLELDRPPPPAPAPAAPRSLRGPFIGLLVIALIAIGGFVGWRRLSAPKDSIIEIVNAPAGAHLALDGVPITGRTLQLPISEEQHQLIVDVPHRPRRTLTFTAAHDQSIDLAGR